MSDTSERQRRLADALVDLNYHEMVDFAQRIEADLAHECGSALLFEFNTVSLISEALLGYAADIKKQPVRT